MPNASCLAPNALRLSYALRLITNPMNVSNPTNRINLAPICVALWH